MKNTFRCLLRSKSGLHSIPAINQLIHNYSQMRGRGSYRRIKSEPKVIEDNEKMKSLDVIEVITIDSDEEVDDDIQVIDSDYGSYSSATSVSTTDEKRVIGRQQKRCDNCMDVLKIMVSDNGNEYNRLTSADFYLNPRIHSSIISSEIRDKNRFNCFEKIIKENERHFNNKTVLVIGSGIGILALFVAKAMAKTVIVYDRPGISGLIEAIIDSNRRRLPNIRTKFFVIREDFDQMVLPNGLKEVDIIVSDWVNNSLFFKSMIGNMIKARDKWLRKDGLIFPDSCHMYISGVNDLIHRHVRRDKRRSNSAYIKRIDYWDSNVYGFDMTSVGSRVMSEPYYQSINSSQIITNECLLRRFDLYCISMKDINFETVFDLRTIRDTYLQTFVMTFDVIFSQSRTLPIMYTTRPSGNKNLFRPTVFFLDTDKQMTLFKDNRVKGIFKYCLSEDLEKMSVDIEYEMYNKLSDKKEFIFYKTF